MNGLMRRVATYVSHHGVLYTVRRAAEKLGENVLGRYDRVWRRDRADEKELQRQRDEDIDVGLISIIIPVYNTRPDLLRALADALIAQTYPHWEACLYDGMSPREDTRAMLREIAALDSRIRVENGNTNEGISGNTNKALDMARGEWIALCDHDDLLSPDAMYRIAACIRDEAPDMIYSDEDKVNEAGTLHTTPHYKPDFCPDNLCSGNYVCHLMIMRRWLVEKAGRFRQAFDGSQDHDLALRCSEHTDKIAHVPYTLYHWRTLGTSMSHQNLQKCLDASCRAVAEHIANMGYPGDVKQEKGSIRIRYKVDDKATVETIRVGGENVYAAINAAAEKSRADYLLIQHESVELVEGDDIREMMMYAQRDDVGAVTPVVTTGMGHIIHGGFAVGVDHIAQCRGKGLPYHAGGWHGIMRTSHNVAAVSAACFMIRRDHFVPFDVDYTGGLGAVDWCLRLGNKGLRQVYTPHARAVCRDARVKRDILLLAKPAQEDAARFTKAWGQVKDPCYSGHFSCKKANYALKTDG